ncbi:hypothetical protein [Clostridium pasteurianum]|uniref:Uncharacterized protein n=1 Tax=Clostridium pasteurianum BC1 TaxID=86416 RepID=R4KDP3_CLOPA|nr:hypothetical protein [Clostridium pasteurianum]AGK97740.1 hypothetical protein Clopa_2902 [Clostridium pasteurianum BC1]
MKYLLISVLTFFILTILSLCKASGDADKRIETMLQERSQKEKN